MRKCDYSIFYCFEQNLHDYRILDTPSEEPFTHLAASLTQYFNVPYALINFIDSDRVWTKATKYGETGPSVLRADSICNHAIKSYDITVIEDAQNVNFINSLPCVVGEPYVRFYAGAPITTAEGFNIGAVCIFDTLPRSFSKEKLQKLKIFADKVRKELERRLENQGN